MSKLGLTDLVSHTIISIQVTILPYDNQSDKIPFALCNKMEELVQNMMAQRVIQHSNSSWASSVVLVENEWKL